ncbi:MAG: hypothetical protein ACR2QM_06995, partial [Longimicrobiales bacterium]
VSDARSESWFRKATREIPILVLGILIAFALQAWWDGARDADIERQALLALRSELELNLDGLETNIRRHDRVAAAAEMFHDAMVTSEAAEISDSVLVAVIVSPTFDPSTGAIESLQRLGSGTAAFAGAVARWRSLVDDATEGERRSRAFTDTQLSLYLSRTVDLPDADLSRLWVFEILEQPLTSVTRVNSSSELRFLLSTRLKWARLSSIELSEVREETHEVLRLVDEQVR